MASRWEQVVVDSEDPARLARWWAEALGYQIVHEEPDEVEIRRSEHELPGLLFTPVPEAKTVKNRLHIDWMPDERTRDEEVERLVALGAKLYEDHRDADGLGWVTMQDPEGNEFCVERSTTERDL